MQVKSKEGDALRGLREIRVQASPSWGAPRVALMFWFVRRDPTDTKDRSAILEKWLASIQTSRSRFEVEGQVVSLNEMTAEDYVGSDPLDLDHLSD